MKFTVQFLAIALASVGTLAQDESPFFTCTSTDDPIGGCCGTFVDLFGGQEGLGCMH